MTRFELCASVFSAAVLFGCTHPECLVEGGDVALSVDVDSGPLFTWTGGEVEALSVSLDGQELWQFQCKPLRNCVESGVVYGEPPEGTEEHTPPTELEPGVTYVFGVAQSLGYGETEEYGKCQQLTSTEIEFTL